MDHDERPDECLDLFKDHRGQSSQLEYLEVNECILSTYWWEYKALGVEVVALRCNGCHCFRERQANLADWDPCLAALQAVPDLYSDEGEGEEDVDEEGALESSELTEESENE